MREHPTSIRRSQNRPLQGPQQFSTEAKWWRLQYRASPRDKNINNTCSTKSKVESVCPKLEILFLRQTYQTMWKISSPRPCVWAGLATGGTWGGTPSLTVSPECLSPHPFKAGTAATIMTLKTPARWLCAGDLWGHFHYPSSLGPGPSLAPGPTRQLSASAQELSCTPRGCPVQSHLLDSNKTRPPGTASQRHASNKAPP